MSETGITYLELEELDSTNRYALDNFESLADKTLVSAKSQTAGRGRRGRQWISPPGENAYVSFLLKDFSFPVYHASWIASLATLEALREAAPVLDVWLKWPNDIYCGYKKIAGILCEVKTGSDNKTLGVVIGIGVNLNMSKETLEAIDQPATSLFFETGEEVNVKNFINSIGKKINLLYTMCSRSGSAELFKLWKKENRLLGKTVEVLTEAGASIHGSLSDFGPDGELLLDTGSEILTLHSGDISIKKDFILL